MDWLKTYKLSCAMFFGTFLLSLTQAEACLRVTPDSHLEKLTYQFKTVDFDEISTEIIFPDISDECFRKTASTRRTINRNVVVLVKVKGKVHEFKFKEYTVNVQKDGKLTNVEIENPAGNYSIKFLPVEVNLRKKEVDVVIEPGSKSLPFKIDTIKMRTK